MTLNKDVELLRNIPLFCKVEPSKLKLLAFTSEHLTYAPGQELFHQGDIGDSAYIIVDGEADVLVDSPNGPIKVATMGKNAFVGEIAILCDVPRTATVTATTKLATIRISKELFFQLVCQFPQMSVEIMRELARRLEHTTHELREARTALEGKS